MGNESTNLAAMLQERVKGLYPDYLGIEFLEAGPDGIKAELRGREDICTLPGTIHGGALMGLADTLGAVATVLNMDGNSRTTTLESKTNFFRRVDANKKIFAECTPLHKGRTTMVWQTRIYDEDDKMAALVTQTQIVIPAG